MSTDPTTAADACLLAANASLRRERDRLERANTNLLRLGETLVAERDALQYELRAIRGATPKALRLGTHWKRIGGEYRFAFGTFGDKHAPHGVFHVRWVGTRWHGALYNAGPHALYGEGDLPLFQPTQHDTFGLAIERVEAWAKEHLGLLSSSTPEETPR